MENNIQFPFKKINLRSSRWNCLEFQLLFGVVTHASKWGRAMIRCPWFWLRYSLVTVCNFVWSSTYPERWKFFQNSEKGTDLTCTRASHAFRFLLGDVTHGNIFLRLNEKYPAYVRQFQRHDGKQDLERTRRKERLASARGPIVFLTWDKFIFCCDKTSSISNRIWHRAHSLTTNIQL